MRFGLFDHLERRGPDLGRLYAERLELLEYADRAGLFAYHVAEHHGTPLAMAPAPGVLLAAVASRTTRLHLGPLCYILPLYDPLRLYEEICMLDHLSGGRLELGIGRGVSNIELNFFHLDVAEARSRFAESLEVLNLAFSSEELTFEGDYYRYDHVPLELHPLQRPHPPYWYPTSSVESARAVAKSGYATIFQGSIAHVAEQVAAYREALGREDLSGRTVGLLRMVFIAESAAEARRVGEEAVLAHEANLGHLSSWRGGSESLTRIRNTTMPQSLDEAVATGWAAVGTPEEVLEQIGAIREATGCNYLVFNPLLAEVPADFAGRALALFAEEVMPKLA